MAFEKGYYSTRISMVSHTSRQSNLIKLVKVSREKTHIQIMAFLSTVLEKGIPMVITVFSLTIFLVEVAVKAWLLCT